MKPREQTATGGKSPVLVTLGVLLSLVLAWSGVAANEPQARWEGVHRVVTVGDVHGDFAHFTRLLTDAGVVDERLRWIGGDTHLVQLGDVVDRGADSRKVLDLLRDLAKQASRGRGRVHALIGNHEAMRMQGDMRYTHPGEYAAFVDRKSPRRQQKYYEATVRQLQDSLPAESLPVFDEAYRAEWIRQFPLGYVEMRIAWSPGGEYGRRVLEHNAVMRIDDTLFVHGGLSPEYGTWSIERINEQVRVELRKADTPLENALVNAETGPLWYRGLARGEETCETLRQVRRTLAEQGVRRIVIGHTPLAGAILPRFDGAVVLADSGLSSHYGGGMSALVIEDGSIHALHQGQMISLAQDRAAYLRALAGIAPVPPLLARYLADPAHASLTDLSCPDSERLRNDTDREPASGTPSPR